MCCKTNRRTGRMVTLGEKIKKLRKDREITQEQLGVAVGVAIVFAALGLIGVAVCVVLGFTVFSFGAGIGIQNTYGIDLWHFICAVIITVLFVAAGTTCFLLRFRKNK